MNVNKKLAGIFIQKFYLRLKIFQNLTNWLNTVRIGEMVLL